MLMAFQSGLVFVPKRELVATPAVVGLAFEDVELLTSDGVALHGWYLPHPQARGTMLFLHGNAGNISNRIESLRLFHQLGLAVLIIDYRGYGRSAGTPDEQGSYRDAQAAWDWLRTEQQVPADQIVVLGRSLGGGVATWLATQQQPAALLLDSTFTSIPDMGAELYPYLPVRLLARIHYDNLSRITELQAPLWLAHSPDDELVPFEHGQRLFAAAPEPKQMFELRGSHNTGPEGQGQRYVTALDDFLAEVLE